MLGSSYLTKGFLQNSLKHGNCHFRASKTIHRLVFSVKRDSESSPAAGIERILVPGPSLGHYPAFPGMME
jgi:hypothetical protein